MNQSKLEKVLRFLKILLTKKEKGRERWKFSPFNPFSYLIILTWILLSIPLFGIIPTYLERKEFNLFKWQ